MERANKNKFIVDIVETLLLHRENFQSEKPVGKFVDLYILCEAIAVRLVDFNLGRQHKVLQSKSIKTAYNKLVEIGVAQRIQQEALIEKIFKSGNGIRGKKTPRQLRNPIIHQLAKSDIDEVNSRSIEIMRLMEWWIAEFRSIAANTSKSS